METELNALKLNNTWDLVPIPPGKKSIGCQWVYKIKLQADGSLERYKAKLMAQVIHKNLVLTTKKLFLLLIA